MGEAGDGDQAVALAREHSPEVILTDIRMPKTDGIEATRRIAHELPTIRVLILTTFELNEYVYDAMTAGASGFMLKNVPPEQLADAVRTVVAGDALLASSITRRLIEEFVTDRSPTARALNVSTPLTPRELEILTLVARGRSNGDIAGELFISQATVKTHFTPVLSKLDLRGRAQTVVVAYEIGLVQPGSS